MPIPTTIKTSLRPIYVFFICILFLSQKIQAAETNSSFVTYEFSGGRFGDNLLSYLHAKWVSYNSGIPLLYKPFPYSSQLVLHNTELHYSAVNTSNLIEMPLSDHPIIHPNSYLYVCPYFPENQWERHRTKGPHGEKWFYFDVDWNHAGFRKMLKELIAPKNKYTLTLPPKEKISVALHVREGGSFDDRDAGLRDPTKFPPIDYYISALQKVIYLFKGMEIYCYLFTDALDPQSLLEQIQDAIPENTPIVLDCRSKNNFHNRNVLEDFFSLFHFDVLIHPESNFSRIPALIHDYAVICSPGSGYVVGSKITIDIINCKINESVYQKLISKMN